MTAILRRILALLLLAASGCSLGSTEGTSTLPSAVTPDATVATQIAAEPTAASFDIDPTSVAAARESPTESPGNPTTAETTGEPMGTVAAGEFRLTVTGDAQFTFDSAGTPASATLIERGETAILRFSLGTDPSGVFAQEMEIAVPADITPGEYVLQGNFSLGALAGDNSDVPMEGRVMIDEVTGDSISGTFEFTAATGGTQPTVISGTFNQIPRVTE